MAEVGSGSKLNFPISGTGKLVPVKDNSATAGSKQKYIDLADLQAMVDGKQASLGYTPVTNARTITINGTSYDLTANRSWTVGDELISNKSDNYTVSSSITYASTKALVDGLATKQNSLGYTPENTTNKGIANGYTPLNSSTKIDSIYLPDSILGQVNYQGAWNASTNTPTIPIASSSNKGYYYIVSVAGSTNIGGITDWNVGDWIISDGNTWTKVDNTDAISSFNGRTGAITLTSTDVTTALGFTPVASATTLSGYGITDGWRIGGNTLGAINSIGSTDNYAVNLITNNIKTAEFIPIASSVSFLSCYSANALTGQYNITVKNSDNTTKTRLKLTTCNADNTDAISLYINGANNFIDALSSAGNSIFRIGSGGVTLYTGLMTAEVSSGITIRSYGGNPTSTTTSHTGVTLGINGAGAGFSPTAGTYTNVKIGTNQGWSLSSTASYEGIAFSSTNITISGSGAINMLNMASNISSSGSGAINFININPSVTITGSAVLSAIYSNISSGTNRYNLNIVGSAVNYLAGNTSIGTTTNTAAKLTIGGASSSVSHIQLIASATLASGLADGQLSYDGTDLILVKGTTRYKVNLTIY